MLQSGLELVLRDRAAAVGIECGKQRLQLVFAGLVRVVRSAGHELVLAETVAAIGVGRREQVVERGRCGRRRWCRRVLQVDRGSPDRAVQALEAGLELVGRHHAVRIGIECREHLLCRIFADVRVLRGEDKLGFIDAAALVGIEGVEDLLTHMMMVSGTTSVRRNRRRSVSWDSSLKRCEGERP
jgi:hypothetical protein